jgi:TonB-dependent starch-binding outer membrane protein SusC
MFEERLRGSFAYFDNKTYDMLLDVPLPLSSGFTSTRANVGEMTNKGFEIELSYDIIKNDNLTWNISGNYTALENEVTKMSELVPTITSGTRKIEVGHAVNEWFIPTWAGVDPANGDPLWYVNGVDGATTNVYANAERVYQGKSALPTYSGGISTSVNYKGFFVDASIYFSGGNKVYEDWAGYLQTSRANRFGPFNATTAVYDGRWQQPGDIATHPRLEWNNTTINNATNTSSRFLYDGDYVRLRDISFGYNVPSSFLKGTGLDGVQLVVRGNNLLTWVKDDRLKYDPEVRADGFTRLTTPPTKSVMFQLNLNF